MAMEFERQTELGFPFWRPIRRHFGPDDPFFAYGNIQRELLAKQAKAARGFPMYECLVECCGVKLKSYKSRQQHLVDKHRFPASYEFFRKARPSKKQRQKSQYKQALNKTQETSSAIQVEEETIDNLVSAVSKLTTADSPSAISFGRSRARGLSFVPRAVN
ncbi:unnamed protein product [Withania somnifera]